MNTTYVIQQDNTNNQESYNEERSLEDNYYNDESLDSDMNEDSLHSDDMCQRNERLDNLESLESGESSVGSQMTLPSIQIPPSFQESALPDPPPLEAQSENLSITYHFGRSRRGSKQLISSDGYSYNVLRTNKNGTTKWQCVVRNKQIQCNAQVCQSGDNFVRIVQPHIHPGVPSAVEKNNMLVTGISTAISNPYKSGITIAKDLQSQNRVPNLTSAASMARTLNRHRQKSRPKHPTSLENFTLDYEHVPDVFDTWKLTVGDTVHIMWSTAEQQKLLKNAKTWYLDGTFKLVREPFKQLYSVHAFVRNASITKQVPLVFILMSSKTTQDYKRLFFEIKDKLGPCFVQQMVMDFELAVWQAARLEFPDIRLRGCVFHWTQAVWKHVQQLGLQVSYNKDPATHAYIKRLLALPMIPEEHIPQVFAYLADDAVTLPLAELVQYIETSWISCSTFPPSTWSAFYQTTRTNNDVEGWHGALNRKAGKAKLPLYLLLDLLAKEAESVSLEVQLVSEGTLSRYQRQRYRNVQGMLFSAWEEYIQQTHRTVRDAKKLLTKCSGLYHPIE